MDLGATGLPIELMTACKDLLPRSAETASQSRSSSCAVQPTPYKACAMEAPPAAEKVLRCWGAEISCVDMCTHGFESGKNHFKNKFCPKCKNEGLEVPAWRVRALTEEMKEALSSNSLSAGFWKVAPASLGGGEFRLVNNTATASGPVRMPSNRSRLQPVCC